MGGLAELWVESGRGNAEWKIAKALLKLIAVLRFRMEKEPWKFFAFII